MKHALQKNAQAAIAALTILAMFIVPLCGTLCATPNHCLAQIAAAQLESDACHHVTMSGSADASGAITSGMNCGQPETIAVAPDETNSPSHADRTFTLASSIAATQHEVPTLAARRASLLVSNTGSPSTNTLVHSAILRI
jgi:hypothetical protein